LNKLVSIIIPLYNAEKYVIETLESVYKQNYVHWECIIVDDHSTDKSFEIAEKFISDKKGFKLLRRNREPKNASVCRNIGAELAKGEYLLFLDADDILAPNCLDQRIKAMSDNSFDFGIFQMQKFREKPGDHPTIQNRTLQKQNDSYLKMLIRFQIPWQISCILWKNEFFKKLGGFDESFQRLQDPEISVRALLLTKDNFRCFSNLPVDSYYRQSDRTKTISNYPEYFFKYLQTNFELTGSNPDLKKDFKKALLFTFYSSVKRKVYIFSKKLTSDIIAWGRNHMLHSGNAAFLQLSKSIIFMSSLLGSKSEMRAYNFFFKKVFKLDLHR
jgi:glycosyltransferase involved in cell wall biosynthesis